MEGRKKDRVLSSSTYRFGTAYREGRPVREDDDDAAGYQRDGGPDVEVLRPQGQEVLRREVRAVVHGQRVGRDAEDGDGGDEADGREGGAGAV